MYRDIYKVKASGKINLFLHIVGKGGHLHALQSLVIFTEFGDALSFSADNSFSLNITGEFSKGLVGDISENLIYRAAYLLASKYGLIPKVKIDLLKNIPIAAGLGGGSADAAATLLGLNKFWNLNISMSKLKLLAQQLGADVSACLESKSVFIEGSGEKLKYINLDFNLYIVLVNPLVKTFTRDVFGNFNGGFSDKIEFKYNWNNYNNFIEMLKTYKNDLTNPAIKVSPVISNVLLALKKTNPDIYNMSGSGATCFAIYRSKKDACYAAKKIKSKYSDWWVVNSFAMI